MHEVMPGVILEDTAGIVVLFWAGYAALFLFLRYLVAKKGKSRLVYVEGILVCLLADRFLALLCDEWYRLTMDRDVYMKIWPVQTEVLADLLFPFGHSVLQEGKGGTGNLFMFFGQSFFGHGSIFIVEEPDISIAGCLELGRDSFRFVPWLFLCGCIGYLIGMKKRGKPWIHRNWKTY